jgi:hypothetical protein
MPRARIEIDKSSLINIINSLKGASLSELCTLAAQEYNRKHGTRLSPAIIRLRVNEWKLKLQFEKRPRGEHLKELKLRSTAEGDDPQDSYVFLTLTDWEEQIINRGRFQGESVFKRMVIGIEPMNWSYWTQTKSGSCQDPKYFQQLSKLLISMEEYQRIGSSYLSYPPAFYSLNLVEVAQKIADELSRRTGIERITLSGSLSEMGHQIDSRFKVDLSKEAKPNFIN